MQNLAIIQVKQGQECRSCPCYPKHYWELVIDQQSARGNHHCQKAWHIQKRHKKTDKWSWNCREFSISIWRDVIWQD